MKTLVANQKWMVITLLTVLIVSVGIENVSYGQTLNVGEPRTVRLFYFLPNDRPYRQDVVDDMKTGILEVQSFFAEQMEAHGHGNKTFNIETDAQDIPIVHRIDADYPDSHYANRGYTEGEIARAFDNSANIQLVLMDINRTNLHGIGTGNKKSGFGIIYGGWDWFATTHELGHAFGLQHDFRLNSYIMSYGRYNRASATISEGAAEFLSVHPYFNAAIPLEIGSIPTFELLSPTEYALGATSVPIQIRVKADNGLHQIIVLVNTKRLLGNRGREVKGFHKFAGETDTIFEFDYDGLTPSDKEFTATGYAYTSLSDPLQHKISFILVDKEGNNNGTTGYRPITLEAAQKKIVPVSERTPQVRDAIVRAVPGVNNVNDVTAAHLARITELSLRSENITSLKEGDFDGLLALTLLDLSENQLTELPADIFNGLFSLTTLSLYGNQLTQLPADVFSGLSALIKLILSDNQLTSLPAGVFNDLSALSSLGLNGNQLTTLPADVFRNLSALLLLELSENQLMELPADVFSDLTALHELYLSGNQLTSLPMGIFSGLSTLTALDLQNNAVTPLPLTVSLIKVADGQFKAVMPTGAPFEIVIPIRIWNGSITEGATTLTITAGSMESETLNVSYNAGETYAATVNIGTFPGLPSFNHRGYTFVRSENLPLIFTELGGHPFIPVSERTPQVRDAIVAAVPDVDNAADVTEAHLAEISRLVLGSKDITILKEGDFDGLSSLTFLGLGCPQLTELPLGIFSGLSSLTQLFILDNQLTSLPEGVFNSLSSLTQLAFLANQLTELPVDVFTDLSSLKELILSLNQLTELPTNVFNGLSSLTSLSVSLNQLTELPTNVFNGLLSLTSLGVSLNQLTELPTNVFNGLSSLTSLGVSFNLLTTLPVGVFSGLSSLNVLNLSDNQLTHLPAGIFSGLSSLTQLNLSNNQLSELSEGIFTGLTALRRLDLLGNAVDLLPLKM